MQNTLTSDFSIILEGYRKKVEQGLQKYLRPGSTRPARLHSAMEYSCRAGGKRLRPTLLLATYDLAPSNNNPLPAAIAIECLHTYSLIHDDLPCLDNSTLRRGKATCHTEFDEATALLAGDALLTYAFELLAQHYTHAPELALTLIQELSKAANSERLIGGQMEDILAEQNGTNREQLAFIHANKTAALIQASLAMGMHLSTLEQTHLKAICEYGFHLGMAFQIADDVLDITSTPEALGKSTGIDDRNEKATYPAIHGLQAAKEAVQKHSKQAASCLETLPGDTHFLQTLALHLAERVH